MSQSPTKEVPVDIDHPYIKSRIALHKQLDAGLSWSGHERNCLFLNTGGPKFANVSAASGLDFPDDGRAVAVVDWDHDGDLDMWVSNRTGPQVRFLRNDSANDNHFVMVRLTGKKGNRDAIGARVSLELEGSPPEKRFQSLSAGSGFSAQSSKWLHFGLSNREQLGRLTVYWPRGAVEHFSGLQTGKRYHLVEGSGLAALDRMPPRVVRLEPKELIEPADDGPARVVLSMRFPMPAYMTYIGSDGRTADLKDRAAEPLLITLWATWCPTCRLELKDFAQRGGEMKAHGVDLLAICIDTPKETADDESADPQSVLEELSFPFESGQASPWFVENLDHIRMGIFNRKRQMSLPCSFLIDAEGRVAAIYEGAVELDRFLADVDALDASPKIVKDAAVPFSGRWRPDFAPLRDASKTRTASKPSTPRR